MISMGRLGWLLFLALLYLFLLGPLGFIVAASFNTATSFP